MNENTPVIRYADQRAWLTGAACRQHDPDLFFPISASGAAISQLARAKKICGRCPVARQCLEYALETGQRFGVWGGTTDEERRALRRRRQHRARARVSAAAS